MIASIVAFLRRHETLLTRVVVAVVALLLGGVGLRVCVVQPVAGVARFQDPSSGVQRTRLRSDTSVTLLSAVNSLPVPTSATAGGDIRGWAFLSAAQQDAIVLITASTGSTLTGPVCLYGGRVADSVTYQLGKLNQAADVVLGGATTGYAEKVSYVGVFDYLDVGGCTATITPSNAATVTVKVVAFD